jgi:hypothetical protein
MKNIPIVNAQRLFLLVLGIKLFSSFLGWKFQSPWILGFSIPLALMAGYIILGSHRSSHDLTDEKFADTCYYLGFIFTITSIIFCLFDLPNIGTKIQEIAVRFGAAMVSTVLGLAVRVYLVSFRRDAADAVQDAEDAVLDATQKFTEQLNLARERLQEFESQVDEAARSSVERVNIQVENLTKNHSSRLAEFFNDLTARNQEAFTNALTEVRSASYRLSDSVDSYSESIRGNLSSIESKVDAFTDAITNRLKTTAFPDDYFAKHLEAPLSQLKESATVLADSVLLVNDQVTESSTILSKALTKLRQKASAAEDSMDLVARLAAQQQGVLDSASSQVSTLAQLTTTLSQLDEAIGCTLAGLNAQTAANVELRTSVEGVVNEGTKARRSLEVSLATVAQKLDMNASATSDVVSRLDANANLSREVSSVLAGELNATSTAAKDSAAMIAAKLDENIRSTVSLMDGLSSATAIADSVMSKLHLLANTEEKVLETQSHLGEQALLATGRVGQVIQELQEVIRKFSAIDGSLTAQSADLKLVSEQMKNLPLASMFPKMPLEVSVPSKSGQEQGTAPSASGAVILEQQQNHTSGTLPVLAHADSVISS